jgi:hypothetical protein
MDFSSSSPCFVCFRFLPPSNSGPILFLRFNFTIPVRAPGLDLFDGGAAAVSQLRHPQATPPVQLRSPNSAARADAGAVHQLPATAARRSISPWPDAIPPSIVFTSQVPGRLTNLSELRQVATASIIAPGCNKCSSQCLLHCFRFSNPHCFSFLQTLNFHSILILTIRFLSARQTILLLHPGSC